MIMQIRKWFVPVGLIVAVTLFASACAGVPAPGAGAQAPNPTMVIVQYVTQVVATVTPAPPTFTPRPTEALEMTATPILFSGFDPFSVQVYYPLMGCPVASRLHVGERALVADNRGGTLGLHMSANIGYAPIFRELGPSEVLDIIEGPFCRTESLVWKVVAADGQTGYVSEGNGENYWLLPIGEKVDKKLLRPTAASTTQLRLGLPAYCNPR